MAIERVDESGDAEYLLRIVTKTADGRYILKATNPDYDGPGGRRGHAHASPG
ncbi:MAG: hypothetical protein U5L11_14260 [Arhodomonas sp.]|nr:hypothetical protein [Arhodomonas sp.]